LPGGGAADSAGGAAAAGGATENPSAAAKPDVAIRPTTIAAASIRFLIIAEIPPDPSVEHQLRIFAPFTSLNLDISINF
jgi:hypothetical protein